MKTYMAKEAESHNGTNDGETSEEDDGGDDSTLLDVLRLSAENLPICPGQPWQGEKDKTEK